MECTGLWDIKGREFSTFMLPSKINQVSQETGSKTNLGLGCALMPSYGLMPSPK